MKVDKLHIRSRFKNLENVKVDFDEDHLMTVVVGRNGSGKSNVLEALVSIFRNLDLGEAPPFSYKLKFQLGENDRVCKSRSDQIFRNGTTLSGNSSNFISVFL